MKAPCSVHGFESRWQRVVTNVLGLRRREDKTLSLFPILVAAEFAAYRFAARRVTASDFNCFLVRYLGLLIGYGRKCSASGILFKHSNLMFHGVQPL